MNGDSESFNNFQAWPLFTQFSGSLFSGGNFLFQGVNPTTFAFNPQYLQLANAFHSPRLIPQSDSDEKLPIPRHKATHPTFRDDLDSIPSSGSTDTAEPMQKCPRKSNQASCLPSSDDAALNGDMTSVYSNKLFSNSRPYSYKANNSSNSVDPARERKEERPFLKFGVQAILSPALPSSTGN